MPTNLVKAITKSIDEAEKAKQTETAVKLRRILFEVDSDEWIEHHDKWMKKVLKEVRQL
jgi:hypothetical protein